MFLLINNLLWSAHQRNSDDSLLESKVTTSKTQRYDTLFLLYHHIGEAGTSFWHFCSNADWNCMIEIVANYFLGWFNQENVKL